MNRSRSGSATPDQRASRQQTGTTVAAWPQVARAPVSGAVKALPDHPPTLTTPRLVLRAMGPADVAALFSIYGDPDVMRFAADPTFATVADVHQLLWSVQQLLRDGLALEWALETRDGGSLIGTCGLHSLQRCGSRGVLVGAEVGCMLARGVWGRGYMREALAALIVHARHTLGLAWLQADIDPVNARSLRLFEALGFARSDGGLHQLQLPAVAVTA